MTDLPPFHQDRLNTIADGEVKYRGIYSDHINSYDEFLETGIGRIMIDTFSIETTIRNERNKTPEDRNIDTIKVEVKVLSVDMKPPTTTQYASSRLQMLTPKMARLEDKTYAAQLFASMEITATAYMKDGSTSVRTATIDQILIASIPIMVKSKLCNLHNQSVETLTRMEESPDEQGGYFIINGFEWIIISTESSTYNGPKVFINEGYKNEVVRLEMISKPGDGNENSAQLYIKLLNNNQLVVIIDRDPLKDVQIPFYIILRLLGWSSDKVMVDWIVHEYDTEKSNFMLEKLQLAMDAKYDPFDSGMHDRNIILRVFISKMGSAYGHLDLNEEATLQYVYQNIMQSIDMHLLPHIGSTPEFRNEKARYITHLIRNLFLVNMGVVPETDRDAWNCKRAHAAGISMAKAFKQQYNAIIVRPIKKNTRRDFKVTQFSKVDLAQIVITAVNSSDFERALAQSITTGKKQFIKIAMGNRIVNRLTSNQLHRKNQLTVLSEMRTINNQTTSVSNTALRSSLMRQVPPSATGYICPIQTQDNPNVGLNKQVALTASITSGGSSVLLKEIIMSDPEFIHFAAITPNRLAQGVAPVKVNGHWIGCVDRAYEFVDRYRLLRREKKINAYTTIHWDPTVNEVYFWTDAGRLVRPLLIVNNNGDDKKFHQWLALTVKQLKEMEDGKLNITDLHAANVIEYITSTEQENCLLAINHDELWKNKNNPLVRYTHCEIPVSLLGIPCLNCPYGSHSESGRVILAVKQSTQACGWFSAAWPYRIDKGAFHQYHCEIPIVRTMCDDYVPPNGQNCIIAIQIYSGYNQEDSIILNKGAVDRGMFAGIYFTYSKCELEKGEYFGDIDPTQTDDIKPYASYEKLVGGFPPKGTTIRKNDVVIGKYVKYTKAGQYKFGDRSTIYKGTEDAVVHTIVVSRNQEGKMFAKVQLLVRRDCNIGDKFAMRSGQKGVAGHILDEADMPSTADGIVPDVIFNPFSLPSRMTINTLMEMLSGKVSALRGVSIDSTIFNATNVPEMQEELKALGYSSSGCERMYNGMTGRTINCEIYIGPAFYQRLAKFVNDTIYAASHGATDVITRQPLEGRSSNGGMRIGEMEKDVITGNGLSRFLSEKFFDHSNPFKVYICRGCGNYATVNIALKHYRCKTCGDLADIAEVDTSWTSKLFLQELRAINIGVRPSLVPYTYESQ